MGGSFGGGGGGGGRVVTRSAPGSLEVAVKGLDSARTAERRSRLSHVVRCILSCIFWLYDQRKRRGIAFTAALQYAIRHMTGSKKRGGNDGFERHTLYYVYMHSLNRSVV